VSNLLIPGVALVNDGTGLYLVGDGLVEGTAGITIDTASKLENAQAFTINGSGFEGAQGTGTVIISPALIDDVGAVEQTVTTWGASQIVINSADLTGMAGGDSVNVFVTNNSAAVNDAFAITIADMVLRVGSAVLTDQGLDTDTGLPLTEAVEVIVHGGTPGLRTFLLNDNSSYSIAAGVLDMVEATLANITTENDTYAVTLYSVANPTTRGGAYVGTVVDRNED